MNIQLQTSEQSPQFGYPFGREVSYQRYYHYSQSSAWEPPVNVYEDSENFYICAELAGIDRSEINVEVLQQEIRIHGERSIPIPCDRLSPECIMRIEIDSGRFFRAIRLPDHADLNSTAARLDRGFLWITVHKRQAQG